MLLYNVYFVRRLLHGTATICGTHERTHSMLLLTGLRAHATTAAGNTQTGIHETVNLVLDETPGILSCSEFRYFWLRWDEQK